MEECISKAKEWYDLNKLGVNLPESNVMPVSTKNQDTSQLTAPIVNGQAIQVVNNSNYLGLIMDKHLHWDDHINKVCKSVSSKLFMLKRLRKILPISALEKVYFTCIQPTLEYAYTIWGNCTVNLKGKIQRLQNLAARIILNNFDYVNFTGTDLVDKLGWLKSEDRYKYLISVLMFKSFNDLVPYYMSDTITLDKDIMTYKTRSDHNMHAHVPKFRTKNLQKAFCVSGPQVWNSLPIEIRTITNLDHFKTKCKKHYLKS